MQMPSQSPSVTAPPKGEPRRVPGWHGKWSVSVPIGVPRKYPLPLPMGEVAERSEDGEGILGCNALSVTFGDSSPKGGAKGLYHVYAFYFSSAGKLV